MSYLINETELEYNEAMKEALIANLKWSNDNMQRSIIGKYMMVATVNAHTSELKCTVYDEKNEAIDNFIYSGK